jgi:hypothetical protein
MNFIISQFENIYFKNLSKQKKNKKKPRANLVAKLGEQIKHMTKNIKL